MGLIVATVTCLSLWVVLWALGIAARDSGIICFTLFLIAAAIHTVAGQVRGNAEQSG